MGRCYKKGKIKWLPLNLYGCSFLRALLRDNGYMMDEGIVLVADNEAQARRFITEYCSKTLRNGVKIADFRKQKVENYQCGLLKMRKGLEEERVLKFLEEDTFLPVILVGGLLPDYLKADKYIFRLTEEDIEEVCSENYTSQIREFYFYMIENTKEVCRVIKELRSSIALMNYDGNVSERIIFAIFTAVGRVYSMYLRQTCTEEEVSTFFNNYVEETKERLQRMKDFASGEDLAERLSSLIWEYMENNADIAVSDVEMVGELKYEALRANRAVLYDEMFYFFPPKLLMEICKPILNTSSEPELKKYMRDEGILHCNSADYTVKKSVINVYGAKERVRLFWICKDELEFPDNLRLEDAFEDEPK